MTVLLYVGQLKVTAEHGGMGARAEERVSKKRVRTISLGNLTC